MKTNLKEKIFTLLTHMALVGLIFSIVSEAVFMGSSFIMMNINLIQDHKNVQNFILGEKNFLNFLFDIGLLTYLWIIVFYFFKKDLIALSLSFYMYTAIMCVYMYDLTNVLVKITVFHLIDLVNLVNDVGAIAICVFFISVTLSEKVQKIYVNKK